MLLDWTSALRQIMDALASMGVHSSQLVPFPPADATAVSRRCISMRLSGDAIQRSRPTCQHTSVRATDVFWGSKLDVLAVTYTPLQPQCECRRHVT